MNILMFLVIFKPKVTKWQPFKEIKCISNEYRLKLTNLYILGKKDQPMNTEVQIQLIFF